MLGEPRYRVRQHLSLCGPLTPDQEFMPVRHGTNRNIFFVPKSEQASRWLIRLHDQAARQCAPGSPLLSFSGP
jgi:hypothetical protein